MLPESYEFMKNLNKEVIKMAKASKNFEWWFEFWSGPLGKGITAIVRNAVIVALGLIVSGLVTLFTNADIDPTTKILIIGALKAIDELLHKTGIAERGLTRF